MKFFHFILLSMLFTSCENKQKTVSRNNPKVVSPSTSYWRDFNDNEKVKALSKKITESGDTIAYKQLRNIFYYSGHISEFLPYSLVMANKYDFPLAYFNVYCEMSSLTANEKNSNKLANYYLFVAFEKNSEHSKSMVKERFGENFKVPNTKEYWISLAK